MSDEAQERKARADKIRKKIHRPGSEPPEPEPSADERAEGESLKEGVERRMRELDEADRDDQPPSAGDDGER
ncbi:hypothetical protein [Streptomyces sp. NPDC002587]